MNKKSNKASVSDLNGLHNLVAQTLAADINDPKILTIAVRFLKDNNITADVLESEGMMNLTDQIKTLIDRENSTGTFSVEDMLNIH